MLFIGVFGYLERRRRGFGMYFFVVFLFIFRYFMELVGLIGGVGLFWKKLVGGGISCLFLYWG